MFSSLLFDSAGVSGQPSTALGRGIAIIPGACAAVFFFLVGAAVCAALVFGQGAGGCSPGSSAALGSVDGVAVPAKLKPIYAEATARYELGTRGPSILASINWNETAFGTNMGDPPGAMGWMSFMPESWVSFGLDGDGDGDRDAYDPTDAILAAAHLLSTTGAPKDWHEALFSYNHSDVYVADVLAEAEEIAGSASGGGGVVSSCGSAGAPNEVVGAMVAEAERLSQLRPQTDYEWGGSHGLTPTPANGPFDCSSAVSHILQVGGFGNPTMDTIAFSGWGEPGPGKWVTLHNKPYGADAHIFIEFSSALTPPAKRYWGTSGMWFGGHGPGWIPESVFGAEYLAGFELRHPPDL